MKKALPLLLLLLVSCTKTDPANQRFSFETKLEPSESLQAEQPMERPVIQNPQLHNESSPENLPHLSMEKRQDILEQEILIMNTAWKEARENTPEGFVFIQGDRYRRQDAPRDKSPEEELLMSFYMSDHEITQEEYKKIMGQNPSIFKGQNRPVENLSWYNAVEYCNKRSLSEGLSPYYYVRINHKDILIEDSDWDHVSGKTYLRSTSNDDRADGYRLPNDAEWEYAAMGGIYRYERNALEEGERDDYAWTEKNSNEKTHNVKEKKANILGLYDTRGNVAEWTDTRTGYFDGISVRGGSWSDSGRIDEIDQSKGIDSDTQSDNLGFRVVRNIPAQDMRYPGLVFSDKLNVRNTPGLSGLVVGHLNNLTPIAVYEMSGTGNWNEGVLDVWLRISDDEWVNGYYVTMIPFFTRTSGRINKLSELVFDITDSLDIREPNFQFYDIDVKAQELLISTAYLSSYYFDTIPFYGIPVLTDVKINPDWLFSYEGDDDFESAEKKWSVYAIYDNLRNDGLDPFPGNPFFICTYGNITVLEGEWNSYFDWTFSGDNTLTIKGEYSEDRIMSIYFTDARHMILKEQRNGGVVITWCCSKQQNQTDIGLSIDDSALYSLGFYDSGLLQRYIHNYYDSPDERRRMWAFVKALILRGAPVQTADRTGDTALHVAAHHWDSELVKALLEAGADPHYRNLRDERPIDLIDSSYWSDNAGSMQETIEILKEYM